MKKVIGVALAVAVLVAMFPASASAFDTIGGKGCRPTLLPALPEHDAPELLGQQQRLDARRRQHGLRLGLGHLDPRRRRQHPPGSALRQVVPLSPLRFLHRPAQAGRLHFLPSLSLRERAGVRGVIARRSPYSLSAPPTDPPAPPGRRERRSRRRRAGAGPPARRRTWPHRAARRRTGVPRAPARRRARTPSRPRCRRPRTPRPAARRARARWRARRRARDGSRSRAGGGSRGRTGRRRRRRPRAAGRARRRSPAGSPSGGASRATRRPPRS